MTSLIMICTYETYVMRWYRQNGNFIADFEFWITFNNEFHTAFNVLLTNFHLFSNRIIYGYK